MKEILLLLRVLWFCCTVTVTVTAFRFQSFSKRSIGNIKYQHRSTTQKFTSTNSFTVERKQSEQARLNQKLLYTIPNSPVPIQSVVSYIHKWALEATATGSSIKAIQKEDGVNFSFSPSPNSYLNVYVDTDRTFSKETDGTFPDETIGLNVFIRTSFGMLEVEDEVVSEDDVRKKKQVHSLINMVAQNLIESLANDIGSLIMNLPENENYKEQSEEEKEEMLLEELEREQVEYDANVLEESEESLRSQVYKEQNAENIEQNAKQSNQQNAEQNIEINKENSDENVGQKKDQNSGRYSEKIEREDIKMREMEKTKEIERIENEKRIIREKLEKEKLPSEKEIMKEWSTQKISDIERKNFIEEMRLMREGPSTATATVAGTDVESVVEKEGMSVTVCGIPHSLSLYVRKSFALPFETSWSRSEERRVGKEC